MNKLTKQLVAGSALGATALIAVPTAAVADEVSVNMGVVSQYILRGGVESEVPALQGGIDYGMDSGAYLGSWWSTLSPTGYDTSTTEVDVYGGFAGEAGGFDYDIGVVYYYYHNGDSDSDMDSDNSMPELYFGGGMGPFGATLYYAMDDGFADEGDMYLEAGYGTDLPADFGFDITVGYAMPDDSELDANLTDTTLSLSYPMGDAEASVNYMAGGKDTADDDVDDQLWFGIGWAY
ncbi:MAG: TorF family putative porin [Thiohalospira sp.]